MGFVCKRLREHKNSINGIEDGGKRAGGRGSSGLKVFDGIKCKLPFQVTQIVLNQFWPPTPHKSDSSGDHRISV